MSQFFKAIKNGAEEGAQIAVLKFFGLFIFGLLLTGLANLIKFLLAVHMDWAVGLIGVFCIYVLPPLFLIWFIWSVVWSVVKPRN